MLTDCVRHTEDHDHEEEEEQDCDCSCEMEKCFGLKDKDACSAMFAVCFPGEAGGEDGYEREEEEGDKEDHCSHEVIECVATNKYNIAACSNLISACTTSNEEARDTRDCYSHIELCYRTTPSHSHQVCSALTPTCYRHTDTSSSCYSSARSCLLNSFIKNSVCERQLESCLDQHQQDYIPAHHADNICKENIKLCLASSQYSASSCYDHLQLFLAGGECSAAHQDHAYRSHQ